MPISTGSEFSGPFTGTRPKATGVSINIVSSGGHSNSGPVEHWGFLICIDWEENTEPQFSSSVMLEVAWPSYAIEHNVTCYPVFRSFASLDRSKLIYWYYLGMTGMLPKPEGCSIPSVSQMPNGLKVYIYEADGEPIMDNSPSPQEIFLRVSFSQKLQVPKNGTIDMNDITSGKFQDVDLLDVPFSGEIKWIDFDPTNCSE